MSGNSSPDPRLVQALRDPGFYPGRPEQVEVRETHASLVFLAGDHAYKLKKPVDFEFLDYSTPERRRLMCEREVALNRRLAPAVYYGVKPVTWRDEHYVLGGDGPPVDYLVHMRRLEDDMMLRSLVERDDVRRYQIEDLSRLIARFHARAARSEHIDQFGSPHVIAGNVEENFEQTQAFVGAQVSRRSYNAVAAFSRGMLRDNPAAFEQRVRDGRVCDGHGDLRTDHVYFTEDGIQVIDCIEFNERFRFADGAADVAFLAMELDAHGAPDLADALDRAYHEASGDAMEPVRRFYRCYRAYTRAKIACFRAEQAGPGCIDAEVEARRYAHLAWRYARDERAPCLVLVSGLSGAGKSTLTGVLAPVLAAWPLSSDRIRKALAGLGEADHRHDPPDSGLYRPRTNERVYAALLDRAEAGLLRGRSIVLDATFRRRADREAAFALARRIGARPLLVECRADETVVEERMALRQREGAGWSDGRWEIYLHQKGDSEPPDEVPAGERLVVDTAEPLLAQVDAILERLQLPGAA